MTRRRPRRPTYGFRWELARHTTGCQFCEGTVHRGTALLLLFPGSLRCCPACAWSSRQMTPPEHIEGPAQWTGGSRDMKLPESDL